eukprot:scaffold17875_cov112-Isochrysis_galbana.AAC.4
MMIIIILGGNVARKNGGAGLWHVGRLCLATSPLGLGLRMWTFHAFTRLPEKGKELSLQEGRRGCSKKGLMRWVRLRFPEGLRSARSMAAVIRNV